MNATTQLPDSDVAANYCLEFDPTLYFRPCTQYTSKVGPIHCCNTCLAFLVRQLDANNDVSSFKLSDISFEFWHPILNKIRATNFDLEVLKSDGSSYLVYVTPQIRLHTDLEANVIDAAHNKAKSLKKPLKVVTEIDVFGNNPKYMKSLIHFFLDLPSHVQNACL